MSTTTNGQVRKTLASQIDRLDSILDGLADNLNEAVADAVREATGAAIEQAVHKALLEVLTSPDLISLIGGIASSYQPVPPAAAPPAEEGGCPGLLQRLAATRAWAGRQARAAGAACHRTLGALKVGLLGLWNLRTRLLAAVGIGATVGLGAYLAGPWLSALVGGAAGCALSLFARARTWLQRMFAGCAFADVTS
jgi:hypothetical protein